MRSARALAFVPIAALLVGGAAAAASSGTIAGPPFKPKSPAAARALAEEQAAYDLVNRASRRVAARRRSCRQSFPRPKSTETHDVPSRPVLDAIAALRRPATAADGLPSAFRRFGLGETYVDYVRTATAASGQRFTIIVARSVRPSFRISDACLDAQRADLDVLLEGKSRRLRSVTLRVFGTVRDGQKRNDDKPAVPEDGIYLFTRSADGRGGGGGGGGNAAVFARRGNFTSQGGNGRALLNGLVPDGVASVTLEYPRVVSRGRFYEPTMYPAAVSRTVKVQQNVLSVRVPRGAGDAFPPRMVWRGADGSVVRVIKQRG